MGTRKLASLLAACGMITETTPVASSKRAFMYLRAAYDSLRPARERHYRSCSPTSV